MKPLFSDRRFWFAVAFLTLNACGWWWVKSEAGGGRRAADGERKAEDGGQKTGGEKQRAGAEEPQKVPLKVTRLEQAALSAERLLTVSVEFNAKVDWKSFTERFALSQAGKNIAWHFTGKSRWNGCLIQTDAPVSGDSVEAKLAAGVRSESADAEALDKAQTFLIPLVPEFRFSKIEAESPSFGHPTVTARFTQEIDAREAAALIACEPKVAFTVVPEPWGGGLTLSGPFENGQCYTFIFGQGLRSADGHKLEKEVRRTVLIQHRRPAVAFAVEGRYLAPEGKLAVPVLAVNTPEVVSSLARVLPQNLVQLAMREAGEYESYYGDSASSAARELAARPVALTNRLGVARNREQRLMLQLGGFFAEPVRGVYLLEVDAKETRAKSRLICVTDIGLSARAEAEAVTVWVTSLRSGRPASGRRVELYGRNNLRLARGVSDKQGFVRLSYAAKDGDPFLVAAQTADGKDSTFLALTGSTEVDQRPEAERGYLGPRACEAFLMGDREMYRHGETLFVQALLRTWEGRPPAPFPVALDVVKPDGRLFKSVPLMPDALGAAVAEVTLPEYLPSGTYSLRLRLPGGGGVLGESRVMLEAFVPPQIRVTLLDLPRSAGAGAALSFTLFAEHLFGKPAGGLGASTAVSYLPSDFKPQGWPGYLFGDSEKTLTFRRDDCGRLKLDTQGKAAYSLTLAEGLRPPAAVEAVVESTVLEAGGRAVSARASFALHAYPFYIGLKPACGMVVRVGDAQQVALAAVSPDGTRRKERAALKVTLEQVSWVSCMRKDRSGLYEWKSERVKTLVSEGAAETGAEDTVYRFTPQQAGAYILTFTDPQSQSASSWSFAAGGEEQSEGAWDRSRPDRVELVFDKAEYAPGETARMQIRSPFAGTAWVSLQQARALENRVLTMTNNTAEVAWRVGEAFTPNVEVAVSVVRPAVAESVWSAHRAVGLAPLRVVPPSRRLKVDVSPEAPVWRPKSVLPVRVAVRDSAGQAAAGARVTLMAVDEGVCMLTAYETPDPLAYFLETRTGRLAFHDVYEDLMPVTDERMFGGASHIGGDGGDELLKRLNPVAARRFKPVALWRANVALNADGTVTVPLDVPEFAGELRLMAVAWDERALGSADAPVTIKRKLVVQPDLPRVLAPGDQAQVQVTLHNESGAACTAQVSAVTQGPLACEAAARPVALAAGESVTVPLKVAALRQAGAARVTVQVEGAGERYAEPVELAVRPASAWRVTAEHEALKPGEEKTFEPPQGVLESSFSQTFYCAAQPTVNLLAALEYVAEYPYGCLEQTVSSVFPLLSLGGLAGRLPVKGSTLGEEAPARINAAIVRVLSMQRSDGFALWPEVWESETRATVYAAHFLVEAAQAGYPVSKETLDEVARILGRRLEDCEAESRAYIVHVLALAGRPEHGWLLRLFELTYTLSTENRFHLARALCRAGEVSKARGVLGEVKGVKGLREAAFGLLAWLEIDPAAPFVAVCCREIEAARREEGHWGTTQDNALALLALGAYQRVAPAEAQTFTPLCAWAGGRLEAAATNAFTWVPGAAADKGPVKIANRGSGAMYVTRRVACVPLAAEERMMDAGLRVRREWLDLQGVPLDPSTLRRGDLVIVQLTLHTFDAKVDDVVVEDLLPACLEVENGEMCKAGTAPWIKADESAWVLHREVRDDRLLLFAGPLKGLVSFHYAARVVTPGEFIVPAVTASAMYQPGLLSRSGLGRVAVQ